MKTTQTDLALKWGVSQGFIADLKKGRRFTVNANLAREMALLYGKKPIDYVHKKKRPVYAKAWPDMTKAVVA